MKKIYYSVVVLVLLSLVIFSGCKKINEGSFPAKPNAGGNTGDLVYITPQFPIVGDASGVLISAQVHNQKTVIVSLFENIYEYGMAKFTNTQGSFNNLTNVGSISLDGTSLTSAANNYYVSPTSNFTIGLGSSTAWQIQGGSSVPAFNYTLNGVYPIFTDSFQNWANNWLPIYPRPLVTVPTPPSLTHLPTRPVPIPQTPPSWWINDSTSYYQNLPAINTYLVDSTKHSIDNAYNNKPQWTVPIRGYVFNADTVFIVLSDGAGFLYQRKIAATDSVANFAPNDFAGYPGYDVSNFTMQLNAIKYRDTTIAGKNYYFLKMGSYIKYYGATK